ncbi:MAG: hypothetical protein SGJ27_20760 [Candidatus Melainabacteria bacterium]|nr:hypothetical protein [Candidatus Melainabacteria bacterium]
MTEATQQNPAPSARPHNAGTERISINIHRGLHAAALHLTQHHIASYEAYANQPTLDHGELHETLIEVTASGVDLEVALKIAHELASHILPATIGGKDTAMVIVVTDCEHSLGEVEGLLQILRDLNRHKG